MLTRNLHKMPKIDIAITLQIVMDSFDQFGVTLIKYLSFNKLKRSVLLNGAGISFWMLSTVNSISGSNCHKTN